MVKNACSATPSTASAEPALKPYQPVQSIPVPNTQSTMLWGGITRFPKPTRGPTSTQSKSADQPEVMCTTIPPAKSNALKGASAFAKPANAPVAPHTACATG